MIKEVNNFVRIRGIRYVDGRDVSYNEVKNFKLRYIVEGIGNIDKVGCFYAEYAKMRSQVEVGEEVLLRWYGVSEAYERGADRYGNYYVRYEDIVCVNRGGWKPVNGNILVSGDYEDRSSVGIVVGVGDDVEYYVGYGGEKIEATDVRVGDYIFGRFEDMREVEHIDNQEMEDKLFVIQDKDILLISSEEIKDRRYYSSAKRGYDIH